jgi:ADP-ribosylation factor-like protein 1
VLGVVIENHFSLPHHSLDTDKNTSLVIMGISLSILGPSKPKADPTGVLLVGLDFAGKTTILHRVKGKMTVHTTIPTIGFVVENLNLDGIMATSFNVGGRSPMRPIARHYYKTIQAIAFVVDSNDEYRLDRAFDELSYLLKEQSLQGKPLLLFCNKQDLPKALSPEELVVRYKLGDKAAGRKWRAIGCSPRVGKAELQDALSWLSEAARENVGLKADSPGCKVTPGEKSALSAKTSLVEKLGYDPSKAVTLKRFEAIKTGTECPFAKSAVLWGGTTTSEGSLEEQTNACVPALLEFVRRSNANEKLDGFCIEIDDPQAREGGPEELGACVIRVLAILSDADPAGDAVMRASYIGARGWRFRFNKADFFVTTFAPCYPVTSSRYSFGTSRAFLLLQPEASFLRHGLPLDTPETNWVAPKTIRDKTRTSYRDAGRPYHIPETTSYPMAEHIVKPLNDDGKEVVRWWKNDVARLG